LAESKKEKGKKKDETWRSCINTCNQACIKKMTDDQKELPAGGDKPDFKKGMDQRFFGYDRKTVTDPTQTGFLELQRSLPNAYRRLRKV